MRKLKLAALRIEGPTKFKNMKRHKASTYTHDACWDNRFSVTESMRNASVHCFYREYFGKPSKSLSHVYNIKYANHPNAIPGIIAVDEPVVSDDKS